MRHRKGFTLLEIMIAIVILGIAIIPMSGMFTTAHLGLKMGSEATAALGIAQSIMEEYKLQKLQGQTLASVSRTVVVTQPEYEYSVEINEESSRLTRVSVTVYYQIKGQERTVSLVTRMGDGWR